MTSNTREDMRYYIPLCMGFVIMTISLIAPPLGAVPTSAIYAGGCFLVLAAAVIGMDIPSILHEVNEMKKLNILKALEPQNSSDPQ